MQFDHHKDFHNSMNTRLRSGITPALFELDALRGDEMLLRARTGAALREATATQSKVWCANFRKAIKVVLSQFALFMTPQKYSKI